GRIGLAYVPHSDAAQYPLGAALWRGALQRARDGRVRRRLGRVRKDPRPDQYAAAAHRTALSRLQHRRRIRGRIHSHRIGDSHHRRKACARTPRRRTCRTTGARRPRSRHPGKDVMKITLDQVVKTFDTFRAVRGVSLEIGSGELVALLGPSGSGKTTILRMVAGLEYAAAGSIHFGDEDATNIPVRERGVGFVFKHYALFPHMTVAENVAFGMKVSKVRRAKDEIARRVDDLLRLVRLEGLGNRFPTQISGGQRQRV